MRILTADHVLPITGEPIANGAVAIAGTDIVAVGQADEIRERIKDAEVTEFGKAAILPGFANCHSHLEITAMRGALDSVEHDFRAWLLKLNEMRAAMSDDEIEAAAYLGAVEGREAGVTCFGDIGRSGHAGLRAMKRAGLRGILFQETEFSPDNRTAEEDFKKLISKFEILQGEATELVSIGLSPHAPYTVGSMLFEMIAQFSIINRVPITIHAAESANETELMTRGTGFFTEVYERFGVEWASPHCTTIEYLERLGVLSARPLLAHCVEVTERDIERIAANGARIAHCPKSNAKFGHGFAPLEQFLDAGIAVGLGSDSVASNNLCDLLEESRFATLAARTRPESQRFIGPREMLRVATLGGAEALGLDDKIGSLEAGKKADLAIISLEAAAQNPIGDVEAALVFSTNGRDTLATYVNGEPIYSRRP
ncbi:MAG: amidohydrolase family protein [Acidobacteria bacterium]|nr:amidohydrolase family protein [Acidobacteriota bacterium]